MIATLVVAGIFAFQPVELAKAVHFIIIAELTAIIEANTGQVFESGPITSGTLTSGTLVTLDCDANYVIFGITLDMGPGTYTKDEIDVSIGGDDIATEIPLFTDSAVAVLDGDEAANGDEDTVIEFILNPDSGSEDVQNIRFSVASTETCNVTVTP